MASPWWRQLNDTHGREVHAPAIQIDYDTQGFASSHHRGTTNFSKPIHLQHLPSAVSPSGDSSLTPTLGKPTVKKRFHTVHLLAAGLSLVCLTLAIIAVASENVSWRLGTQNHQLIVLGFLLSVMNLSLTSVTPTLFLLLEARFGPSSLQNYDGILRNRLLNSKLSFVWRLVLAAMLALPLGLSAVYKSFAGGESAMKVNAIDYIGNSSYYGMFAPPGLQSLGEKTGITLFSNATLPFQVASSSQFGTEPPLPMHAQAYGYNVLLLNNESAAMLDIPQPSYVSAVQSLLAAGESWKITAPVLATVATLNHSKTTDPLAYESFLNSYCEAGAKSSGAYSHASMMNDWCVELLDHASPGDQSLQYVALLPDPGIDYISSCTSFSQHAKLFDLNRRLCEGTWSVTRGGIQLVDGSCNGNILPPEKQLTITDNTMFLGVWYMSSLVEFLGPFATTRNESRWTEPYMATAMAAMVWSRITVLDGAANVAENSALPKYRNLSYEDVGLFYSINDTVVYSRPTLEKSALLYCVFVIQPLLIIVTLGGISMLHSTPLDKGFGLISILSGVDPRSLDILAGAALSGEIASRVKLVMQPSHNNQKGAIEYHVVPPSTASIRNGRLASKVIYH